MIAKSAAEDFNFPYLYDNQQVVAKNFGAQKTPHAYVIWKENNKWVVKYNGAIDDNGAEPEKVQINYVAKAVEALLNDKKPQLEIIAKELLDKEIIFKADMERLIGHRPFEEKNPEPEVIKDAIIFNDEKTEV